MYEPQNTVEGGSTPETWELIRRMGFPIKKV